MSRRNSAAKKYTDSNEFFIHTLDMLYNELNKFLSRPEANKPAN